MDPIIDKLIRRGGIWVNRCYLCKQDAESCNHILLRCPIAYSLWFMVYGLLGINWVIAGTLREELWAWGNVCKQKKHANLIPLTIFWVLWKERNRRAFEGRSGTFVN